MEAWALAPIGAYLAAKVVSDGVYRAALNRIPLRIHVNGTRGKSQTTELATLGLQAGGIRAMGKLTGTAPMLIHTDGTRTAITRRLPASIREQQRTVRWAVREGAQALVVECMAIKPELQWVSEHRMVRSQIGVITNVRADHTDVLGESGDGIARSLACTIPHRGILFTTEQTYADILAAEAEKRQTALVCVRPDPLVAVRGEPIPLWIHPENLALALAVCEHAGVPRGVALRGMLGAAGDAGRFGVLRVRLKGKSLLFANAFAANDPHSTGVLLRKALSSEQGERPVVVLFNHRRDRFFRAEAFSAFASDTRSGLLLIGDRLRRPGRLFPDAVDLSAIRDAADLWERIVSEVEDGSLVVGVGNIAGIAARLVAHLRRIGAQE